MNDPLFLIDAYSQIFRVYYAVRQLSNSRGEAVNALFGFTRLLLRIEREYPTRRGALVFDCGRVKFRQELIPEYKANRKPTPEDLKAQVPAIREMAQAFGWPLEEEPEYEADDLIGALALAYPGEVRIVSADKDLSQLIDERITQLIPSSKNGFEPRGIPEVRAKFGVGPERVVDYLSLLGDAADNIPGAEGIGAKGASEILNRYGALEPLLEHPEQVIEEKRREKLIRSAAILKRNIALIKLKTELPARFASGLGCEKRPADFAAIEALCRRYELRAILKDLGAAAPEPTAVAGGAVPSMPKPSDWGEDDLFQASPSNPPSPPATPEPETGKMVQDDLFSF